jgi:hypothetical protein
MNEDRIFNDAPEFVPPPLCCVRHFRKGDLKGNCFSPPNDSEIRALRIAVEEEKVRRAAKGV